MAKTQDLDTQYTLKPSPVESLPLPFSNIRDPEVLADKHGSLLADGEGDRVRVTPNVRRDDGEIYAASANSRERRGRADQRA